MARGGWKEYVQGGNTPRQHRRISDTEDRNKMHKKNTDTDTKRFKKSTARKDVKRKKPDDF